LIAAGALALVTVPAAAQKAMGAKHEVGVDVAIMYQSLSLGGVSANHILLLTPVDVRLGLVPKGKAKYMFEPRFVLAFDSKDPNTGQSAYVFTPDLNLLFAKDQRKGMYWTVGAGIEQKLSANWSAKAEFRYVDLGSSTVSCTSGTSNCAGYRGEFSNKLMMGLVGLNYKF